MKKSHIKSRKKKAITLLEIMIVIFLIGLIGSVIGYNVKGSLEEGKAFRSEQGIEKLNDIFQMEMASGVSAAEIVANPAYYLEHSGLVANADKLLQDGWKQPYKISAKGDYALKIKSDAWDNHKDKKQKKLDKKNVPQTVNAAQSSSDED
jgi:type II secretory pathway pseudopilin PulG